MADVLLVTGAAGFIGRHLCAELIRRDHEVIALDNDGDRLGSLDIADHGTKRLCDIRSAESVDSVAKSLRTVRIPTLLHMAALAAPRACEKQPDIAWATNVQGTYNVLRLAQTAGIRRVVFFSTAHVYGISPKYFPTDENHPLSLQDTYTSTKIVGEALCDLFFRNYGISYTVLRLFNGYGPGQSEDYFIGAKIAQARTPLALTPPWEPDVTKDWVHVTDIVDAVVRTLKTDFVGPINIGTGFETDLGKIVQMIGRWTGSPIGVAKFQPFEKGPTRMRCDWGRAQRILGWEPKVKFETGLYKMVVNESGKHSER